jgi:RNA polymerase sigma factor (sigma-70 family)
MNPARAKSESMVSEMRWKREAATDIGVLQTQPAPAEVHGARRDPAAIIRGRRRTAGTGLGVRGHGSSDEGRRGGAEARRSGELAGRCDPELVGLCLEGDGRAWATLVRRYRGLVFSVPHALGLRAEDAEEVFQDTFLALYQKLPGLRRRERLAAWLAVTARNKALDRVTRGAAVHEVGLPEGIEPRAPADLPLETLLRLERQNEIRLALAALPRRCRELIRLLFYVEPAPSYIEVARRLGMPRGSLGPTRRRCFDRLDRLLSRLRAYPGQDKVRPESEGPER